LLDEIRFAKLQKKIEDLKIDSEDKFSDWKKQQFRKAFLEGVKKVFQVRQKEKGELLIYYFPSFHFYLKRRHGTAS
jgi:hypothetical protein